MRIWNWGGLLVLAAALASAGPSEASGLSDDGRVGMVADLQGTLLVRPVGRQRWSPVAAQSLLLPGDEIRTMLRGAHAAEIRLRGGGSLVLGAGARVKLLEAGKLRVFAGELEVTGSTKHALQVIGPGGFDETLTETAVLRARDDATQRLEKAPRWLEGYRASTTDEWMGSLVAQVDGRDVPLSVGYHKVDVVIRDQIAVTTIEESFVNATSSRLEGVFSFPLPAGASISGFAMWIGDEMVQADIIERQRARAIYEDIRRRKKDPGLLEWSGGNLFKASVFPIEAHSEKRIRLRYTQVLPLEGSRIRYRYALRSELLRTNPLRRLQIRVRNHSSTPIETVSSPTHDVTLTQSKNDATVEFDAVEYTPERDLEIVFGLGATTPLRVVPHRRGDDGYFMLMLAPPDPSASGLTRELVPEGEPLDVVFVADTSGSMGPEERREQRAFLAATLALLGENDRFRLMACDAVRTWIVEDPLPVTDDNVERALTALERRVSLGWTDLRGALTAAAERTSGEALVVYVGDGIETTGDADPVALAQWIGRMKVPADVGFHAVAAGSAYEEGVLDAIAKIGADGSARATEGDPAHAAYALLAEVAQPSVKDLQVTFGGVRTARVYPEHLPRLPAGTQQTVLGRFLPDAEGAQSGSVTVTGTLDGQPVRYSAELELATDEEGNSFLPRLWARKHLDALLAEGRSPEIQEEIVSFSERFGIMTPYTSFLVLESDEDRVRYGVTRRVHMRDGERFFAAAKSAANTEALREQVTKARSWRLGLRRRMLAQITGLGRDLYTQNTGYAYGLGGGAGGGSGRWDSEGVPGAKSGVYRGPAGEVAAKEMDSLEDHNETVELEEEIAPDSRDPSDPPPPPGEPMPLRSVEEAFGKRSAREQVADFGGPTTPGGDGGGPSAPTTGGGGGGRFRSNGPFSQSGGRRDQVAQSPWVIGLPFQRFPPVPPPAVRAPAPAESAPWSEEIRTLLDKLATPPTIRAETAIGLDIRWEEWQTQPVYMGASTRTGAALVGADRWITRFRHLGQESHVHWLARDRGVHTGGTRLGRRREGSPDDRDDWALLVGRSLPDYTRTHTQLTAEIVARDGVLVTIRIAPPAPNTHSQVFVIDTEKNVIVQMDSFQEDELVSSRVSTDWIEAGGLWWTQSETITDAEGKETWRRKQTVTELAADSFTAAFDAAEKRFDDVIFIGPANPTPADAKQAIHDAEATLADHLAMVGEHASTQRWDDAWASFEIARTLAEGKPGIEWVAAQLYPQSRRGELFVGHVRGMAEAMTGRSDAEARPLASMLFQLTYPFHANERLTLLDRLESVGRADDDTARSRWWARSWDRQRATLLFSIRDYDAAVAIWRRIWDSDRANLQNAAALLNALAQIGDVDAALAVVAELEADGGTWPPHQVQQVFRQLSNVLWNALRYDELRDVAKRWIVAAPEDAQAYHVWLTALTTLERIDESDTWVAARLDEAADIGEDKVRRAQLGAAVSMALGDEWSGYWRNRPIDEKWARRLSEVARLLARQEQGDASVVQRIIGHQRHLQTDAAEDLRTWLRADMTADGFIESVAPARLAQYQMWLRWDRNGVDTALWRGVTDRVITRWRSTQASDENNDRSTLFRTALMLLDVHEEKAEAVDLLRESLKSADGATAVLRARALLARLVTLPWTAELENEAFTLVPRVVTDESPDAQKQQQFSAYSHWLAEKLHGGRVEAELGSPEEREKLPRKELRANQRTARTNARRALAERFATAAGASSDLLRPWYEMERISFLAELGQSADVEGEAREMLLSIAAENDLGVEWVLRERSVLALSYVAVRSQAPEGLAERVLALLQEKVTADDKTLDWRYAVFRLLVVLDRPAEIETTLSAWIVPAHVESRWRIALGYVLAELERLDEAVPLFEEVARLDELAEPQYITLADWYLVLDDDAARERTLERRYTVVNEYQLRNLVQQEYYRVQPNRRSGDPPADLDDEILRVIRVMLAKSSRPEQSISTVYSLYRTIKDTRLLASLAEGVVGHTPEAIYPYLQQTHGLMNQVHEEATCDDVRDRVTERLATVTAATDRRGLELLLSQVERRAGEVLDQPGPHLELALRHLRAARKGEWLRGEKLLMAHYLAALGRIPHEALAEEQVAQLRALHELAEKGSGERLRIAQHTFTTIWNYGEPDAAIDGLASALDEYRAAVDGVLPATVNDLVSLLADWQENRKQFTTAETRLLAGRERQGIRSQKEWYSRRLFRLYVRCVRAGVLMSIGRGAELYAAARDQMHDALAEHAPDHLREVLDLLCRLHQDAKQKRVGNSAEDIVAFSKGLFPELLPRFGQQQGDFSRRLAEAMKDVAGRRAALAFLIERLEVEPSWRRRRNVDGWSSYGYRMAEWRRELGASIGDLEPRLLAIVLRELERDLVSQQPRGRYIYGNSNSHDYWRAQQDEFLAVARRVLIEHAMSPGRVRHTAEYFWNDLRLRDEPISVLQAADTRGVLRENGHWRLVTWLRHEQRWAEMLPHAETLVAAHPDNLGYRLANIRALHGVERDDDGRALAVATYTHFTDTKDQRRRQLLNLTQLAGLCLECTYHDLAVTYYGEAIRDYERRLRGRIGPQGDGHLSNLYASLSRAYAGLGKHDEAVDAASSAVVVMGRSQHNRQGALSSLKTALAAVPDLDAWIVSYDAEAAATGTDAPVIRRALASLFLDRKAPSRAVRQAQAALRHYPEDVALHAMVIRAHRATKDTDALAAAMAEALFQTPAQPKLYGELSRLLRGRGDEDGAERALTGLAEYAPNESEGHQALAALFTKAGRHADAVVQWRQVVRIRTKEIAGWLQLAVAQSAADDRDGARVTLDEVAGLPWAGVHRKQIDQTRKQLELK